MLMEKRNIEQLWYTWSNLGLDGDQVGYRIRAASPGLRDLYGARYSALTWYLRYRLPSDVPETLSPAEAPVSLSFLRTDNGYLLTHKVYVGLDGWRRAGNYFVHLLMVPETVTANEAIELWASAFWQRQDVSLQEQAPDALGFVALQDLSQAATLNRHAFDFSRVEDALQESICAFLAANRAQQRLLVYAPPEQVATLIWGLTHSIPVALLADLTFTTYDDAIQKCDATIIGTMTAGMFSSTAASPKIDLQQPPRSYGQSAPGLDEDIAEFARFAVTCLQQTAHGDGRSPELAQLLQEAGKQESNVSVEAFIKHFKASKKEQERAQALLSDETLQARPARVEIYPPLHPTKLNKALSPASASPTDRAARSSAHVSSQQTRLAGKRQIFPSSVRSLRVGAIVVVLALLLITNLLTSISTYTITSGRVQAGAATQAPTRVTQTPRPSTPTSTVQPPASSNPVAFLFVSPQQKVAHGTDIELYLVLKNTDTQASWSYHTPDDGYYLACAVPTDSDCAQAIISTLGNQAVPPGGAFLFVITIHAHFANPPTPDKDPHTIILQFEYDHQPLGDQKSLSYKVI